MPAPTLQGDEKEDQRLNPGQQDYDRRFNDIVKAEEKGTFGDPSQENANIQNLRERESEGDAAAGGWKNNVTSGGKSGSKKSIAGKAMVFAKKRGGILGILAALGVSGGILAGVFGPMSMVVNLMENISLKNDSSSTALQRRVMKTLGFSTAESDPVCANKSKSTIKCRMGRISNSALNQLERKGIVANFDNDTSNNRKRTGYPTKNPSSYTVDLNDGAGSQTIAAKDFSTFLASNPKFAAKILGTSGAFNLRLKAWSGKHITQKFYSKFGLNRNGGLADGANKKLPANERLKESLTKLRESMPSSEGLNGVSDSVSAKVDKHLGAAKKGGAGYTVMVAGCIGVKAPGYIAAGVAGVQLAQMLPLSMDVILSPGSKVKSSGVDIKNSVTSEDMDTIGTIFTNETPRESDGELSSALDSPYLLAAMGVNAGKPAVSKKYTPGFSILTNPSVRAAATADKAAEPACNALMSPAAMYSAMAVDAVTTVALSATVVGGIAKFITGWAVAEIAVGVTSAVAGEAAKAAITDLAKNDEIATAEGEGLGDVLGISSTAFFAAGGMSRHLPTLKESEVESYQAVQKTNEAFQRDMDIASLSPFDASSKYTFMGSILNNARLAVISSGSYTGNIFSTFAGLASMPFSALSANAYASNFTLNTCGYAKDFGLEAATASETPAINMAGLPCTGITTEQESMTTDAAINLILNEGWLDETQPIADGDTIEDLVTKGYIKGDTPLADFIESCSNPDTGDYLFNSASCTTSSPNTAGVGGTAVSDAACSGSGDSRSCASSSPDFESGATALGLKDPRSLAAMSVFLLDYQAVQSINGEDEDSMNPREEVPDGTFTLPTDPGYTVLNGWGDTDCADCSDFHTAVDIGGFASGSAGKPVYSIGDGVIVSAIKANGLKSACTTNGIGSENTVTIRHTNGLISVYKHMSASDITVSAGDDVVAGQQIGKISNCGKATEPHLHFETIAGNSTNEKLIAIGGTDENEGTLNPSTVMSIFGVDILNGVYTDGRQ